LGGASSWVEAGGARTGLIHVRASVP
jgi:hypothetical protein